jgi:hypothetical protein
LHCDCPPPRADYSFRGRCFTHWRGAAVPRPGDGSACASAGRTRAPTVRWAGLDQAGLCEDAGELTLRKDAGATIRDVVRADARNEWRAANRMPARSRDGSAASRHGGVQRDAWWHHASVRVLFDVRVGVYCNTTWRPAPGMRGVCCLTPDSVQAHACRQARCLPSRGAQPSPASRAPWQMAGFVGNGAISHNDGDSDVAVRHVMRADC